jgi:hypothetical protein
MISIFPYLKHLNITVIVQAPPKADRLGSACETAIPDPAMFQDVRPSSGAFLKQQKLRNKP